MNPIVKAQLSENERRRLGRALGANRHRELRPAELWLAAAGVATFLLAVIFLADRMMQVMNYLLPFLLVVVLVGQMLETRRLYALVRRLHDISASALEGGETPPDTSLERTAQVPPLSS